MNRILISFTFVSILSITNGFSFSQQNSPTYASQAGANQQYNQQQGNNNNVPNWQTQLNNRNNNNNNTPQNGYYNNPQNNNPNNNVNVNNNTNNNTNNPFLKNTIRKNEKFSTIIYGVNKRGKLYKRTLGYRIDSNGKFIAPDPYLKKAIVIFFGDWCPNCAKFLSSLSRNNCQYIKDLISSGIKIVFISVPSIERIQNWQDPSRADYNEANNKLKSFGIDLTQLDPKAYDAAGNPQKNKHKKVELFLLGDSESLTYNAIDSLPVMIAISNSTEQFRGGSDNSLDVVNFENPVALQQFKSIWDEKDEEDDDDEDDEYEVDEYEDDTEKYSEQGYDEEDDEDDIEYKVPKKKCKCKKKNCQCNKKQIIIKKKKKGANKCNCSSNKKSNTKKKNVYSNRSKNDIQMDNFYTEMLNKGCHCAFDNNNPPPIPKRKKVIKKATPVVIQKDYIEEDFIEEEVPIKKTNWKCIKQTPRPICKTSKNSKLQQTRKKIRNKIERAIEKREQRSCDCSRRN